MSATPLVDEILATVPTGAMLGKITVKKTKTSPDVKEIRKIYEFWQEIFTDLREDVFKDKNTTTITFARAVPNEMMDNMAVFKERNKKLVTGSLDEDIKKEQLFLIKSSGCLVSLAEIEAFIGSDPEKIFDDLKALKTAATDSKIEIDLDAVNRGIRACRELSDLIRKISYCKKISTEFSLPYFEMLALYRQEGALALTPFKNSYPFGTLITTEKGRCRSAELVVQIISMKDPKKRFDVIERERTINREVDPSQERLETLCKRPGFNLAYSTSLKTISDESFRMIMIIANLLATAGLDTILKNNPTTDDELSQLFTQNLNNDSSETLSDLYHRFSQLPKIDEEYSKSAFAYIFIGLMMFILEKEDGPEKNNIPSILNMGNQASDFLNELFKSHSIEKISHKSKVKLVNICLVGNQAAPDTFLCLRIQAMWYSTRKFPYTLLAIKNRNTEFKTLSHFSPFVTYLRFHTGEITFLGILIRILTGFPALKKFWSKSYNSKNAPPILDFPDLDKTDEKYIVEAFNAIKSIPDSSEKPLQPWISLGLADYYIKSKINLDWLKEKNLKTNTQSSKIAASALIVLTIIKKHKLVDTLNTVLEFTPIKDFFELKVFEFDDTKRTRLFRSKIFTKAHSFERVRLVYEAADKSPVKITE